MAGRVPSNHASLRVSASVWSLPRRHDSDVALQMRADWTGNTSRLGYSDLTLSCFKDIARRPASHTSDANRSCPFLTEMKILRLFPRRQSTERRKAGWRFKKASFVFRVPRRRSSMTSIQRPNFHVRHAARRDLL